MAGAAYACLSPEEWQSLYRGQGGRCVLCDAPLRNRYATASTGKQAACDHSHHLCRDLMKEGLEAREAVRRSMRGLICAYPCNARILPFLRDCPNLARVAGEYLDAGPVDLASLAS